VTFSTFPATSHYSSSALVARSLCYSYEVSAKFGAARALKRVKGISSEQQNKSTSNNKGGCPQDGETSTSDKSTEATQKNWQSMLNG